MLACSRVLETLLFNHVCLTQLRLPGTTHLGKGKDDIAWLHCCFFCFLRKKANDDISPGLHLLLLLDPFKSRGLPFLSSFRPGNIKKLNQKLLKITNINLSIYPRLIWRLKEKLQGIFYLVQILVPLTQVLSLDGLRDKLTKPPLFVKSFVL